MLGEPLLHRHMRIPPNDNLVRFLVIAPERTELVRYKLGRSPLLRDALEDGNFHIIKSDHLRRFLGARAPRPRRPGAAPRARPGHRADRRADAPLRRLTAAGRRLGSGAQRPERRATSASRHAPTPASRYATATGGLTGPLPLSA